MLAALTSPGIVSVHLRYLSDAFVTPVVSYFRCLVTDGALVVIMLRTVSEVSNK